MAFPFVNVNEFKPNGPGWSTVANIDRWVADPSGRRFTFFFGTRSLFIEVLGPLAYRLRFNPAPNADYSFESTIAVVSRDLGLAGLVVTMTADTHVVTLDTGSMVVKVGLSPFTVQVFRGGQLIHQDQPGQGVLYIPGAEVIAVVKTAPQGALYVGGGEKAGTRLYKNQFTLNYFNYDNFKYNTAPALGDRGPLNPSEPLYCSIPFLIELNPGSASPYAYGIFLDNTGQSFINVLADDYSNMDGKYYIGALYNDLDYYFMAGSGAPEVIKQYTTLTGRAPLPPRYVLGFHQGAYGYFDHHKLSAAADAYRSARIPCDGLHIDVDFQDNYRTFTHSEVKFPNCQQYLAGLRQQGFKMSTNITPIITDNKLGETGVSTPYAEGAALNGALIKATRAGQPPSADPFVAGVFYGFNNGNNPFKDNYPPLQINSNGQIPLQAPGSYPELGLAANRQIWGQQYAHLVNDLGMDMIWQDMTCPALDKNLPTQENLTFPGDLMMAREAVDAAGRVQVEMVPNAKLHNSYVLNLLRATYNGLLALRPQKRNFIIARGGFAGMQRYAALWTGDSASSWDFLRVNLPEVLNLGLSGVPLSGCDIGGFAGGEVNGFDTSFPGASIVGQKFQSAVVVGGVTNFELLTRWMQLGSFLPWYRNHYDGYNKAFQEPFAYGEPVPTNCRRYVELRYRMLQVYYDAMYECTQTGLPIARALFLNDPGDPGVYSHCDDQFFVGADFLVAPILDPHASFNPPTQPTRSIYLPAGSEWYSFMDNQAPLEGAVGGGTTIPDYFADLDRVPVYVRAGAILPFCELQQWVGQLPVNPLTFNCYPGPDRWTDDRAYRLLEDDGETAAGPHRLSRIYQRTTRNGASVAREVRVSHIEGAYAPPANFYFVAILGSVTKPQTVLRDGTALPDAGGGDNLSRSPTDSWYWNASIQIAFAKVFDNVPDTTLTFNY